MMKVVGIIPSRFDSSRLPGKPLADIGGMSMIERVYRRASQALDCVVVAADDQRIVDEVERFGGRAIMTSPDHTSGTDRVYEAFRSLGSDADVVVNIQGDEPFIDPGQIRSVVDVFKDSDVAIATLARRFNPDAGWDALFDSNAVKVVLNNYCDAMYFSRSIMPYVRGHKWDEWIHSAEFYIHVGLYAYRSDTLRDIVALPVSPLEQAESLEQLRWLQAGIPVRVAVTDIETIGVDTPEDLARAIEYSKCND